MGLKGREIHLKMVKIISFCHYALLHSKKSKNVNTFIVIVMGGEGPRASELNK